MKRQVLRQQMALQEQQRRQQQEHVDAMRASADSSIAASAAILERVAHAKQVVAETPPPPGKGNNNNNSAPVDEGAMVFNTRADLLAWEMREARLEEELDKQHSEIERLNGILSRKDAEIARVREGAASVAVSSDETRPQTLSFQSKPRKSRCLKQRRTIGPIK